jgi:hypothetical protein
MQVNAAIVHDCLLPVKAVWQTHFNPVARQGGGGEAR